MNFRALLAAAVLLPAGASYAQDACNAGETPETCTGTTINFCNDADGTGPNAGTTDSFDCAQAGANCGEIGCSGPSAECSDGVLRSDCVAPVGSRCIGISRLVNADTTDDDSAFALSCEGDATCVTGPNADGSDLEDSCVAHIGAACTVDTDVACVGDVVVFCRRFIENQGDTEPSIAQLSNFGIDCAALGGTCNPAVQFDDGTTGPDCEFPTAGEGEGEGEGDTGGGEGEGEGNARDDQAEPAPSGCKLNAFGALPAFGPLALALLALRRRRR
jgi:MYXO-CTERM domain-containing protein